ncbi:MAG: dephospho-CoA kinase [Lapillicoccus sp.]
MLRIGLTGGIGSGKSTVAGRLGALGALVVDADEVAREVVEPGTPVLAAVADAFERGVLRTDGSLDRGALAGIVFTDPAALARLEALTGPAISDRVARLVSAATREAVVVEDMPLLVERRLWPAQHLTVVVGASEATRLERLVGQRGMPLSDARARMAAQASDSERRAAADVWVDNDGDRASTEAQVLRLWHERLVPYNHNLLTRTRSERPEHLTLVDPDPAWPAEAARLVARIEVALGERAESVDHIGSTSVPGLLAKDVIDLQIGVRHLGDADDPGFVDAMEQRGFIRVPGNTLDQAHPAGSAPDSWRKRFHGSADPGRIAHVHVREIGSAGWEFALLFGDWLRSDQDERDAYAAEKRRLLTVVGSTSAYAAAKEPWFATAYPRAMGWAHRTGWRGAPGGAE